MVALETVRVNLPGKSTRRASPPKVRQQATRGRQGPAFSDIVPTTTPSANNASTSVSEKPNMVRT